MAKSAPRSFKNLVDLYEQACRDFGSREVFGTKKDGTWSWLSYAEFGRKVDEFRAGLASLGVGAGDRIAIIANNRVEWAVAAYATYGRRGAFVPMYESQLPDEWIFILRDCGAKMVIAATAEIYETLEKRRVECPALEHILGLHLPASDQRSFLAVQARGAGNTTPPEQPAPNEVADFIYTAGTTGEPKGVVLTHKNFVANLNAVNELFTMDPGDRSLAFLPWAHAFGQMAELHSLLSQGVAIAINDEIPNLVNNLSEVRPTILIAVPRIFNRIYDGINKQMADKPAPIRSLFRAGVAAATRRSRGEPVGVLSSMARSLADALIFKKVRAKMGGRLRVVICGSAALSKDVAEFVDALGIDVYEGYGLTEAAPVVSVNYPGHRKLGSIGKPLPNVRVVIDTEVTGDPVNGEIVVYGDNVMQGYHNRPAENAAAFTADGGLRTGDMGRIDEDGYIYITGRIKEQYKLETGKYVVPSPLEEELRLSPYIANVMLYGDNKPHNVALVIPDREAITRWATQQGKTLGDPATDPAVRELLRAELASFSERFKSYERPKDFVVVNEDFTVESGLLTPKLSVKRRNVLARYGGALEALYR
ncbi:MAG TPA: long-chain fatty acid--CoA ligase [Polyangiaceae bacterium]